jgi:hypothetical protein
MSKDDYTDQRRAANSPDTPTAELHRIAEGLGYLPASERAELAGALVRHPNFTEPDVAKAIDRLNAMWWGDDPTECRLAIAALELAGSEAGIVNPRLGNEPGQSLPIGKPQQQRT